MEAAAAAEALAHENDPNNPRNKLFRAQQEAADLKSLLASKVEGLRSAEEEKEALKVSVANSLRELWQVKGALAASQAETSRLQAESQEYQDADRRRAQEEAVARAKREREEAARALREKELAEKRRRQAQQVFEEVPAQDLAAERARYEDAMVRMRKLREAHEAQRMELEHRVRELEERLKAADVAQRKLAAERHQREEELGFFRRRLSELIRVSHMQAGKRKEGGRLAPGRGTTTTKGPPALPCLPFIGRGRGLSLPSSPLSLPAAWTPFTSFLPNRFPPGIPQCTTASSRPTCPSPWTRARSTAPWPPPRVRLGRPSPPPALGRPAPTASSSAPSPAPT